MRNYRSYKCKFELCEWEGRRVGIEDHYLNTHGHSVLIGPENQCWWKNTKSDLFVSMEFM
ncbi:hypothetical protein NQ314_015049 [Rhamnusium bicolor]|uniref:Uncharacterized protein n=1 Tax=Rhamnusium bicolor TaxID=1586634 RepID=A0AAV8WZ52_9CUCU|nr:hypothetical protein NQ314_015049 [Rhamnusium bicolor]